MSEATPLSRRYHFVMRDCCPGCGSHSIADRLVVPFDSPAIGDFIRSYFRRDPRLLDGWNFHVAECGRCGLVFQKYIGDGDFLGELYSSWVNDNSDDPETDFPGYKQDVDFPLESRDAHELMMASAFLDKPIAQLRTLDFGMGLALWARTAARLGADSHGTDLSPLRTGFARRHGIKIVPNDEIPAMAFDFINTEQVFEHVPDPHGLARLLAGSLKPGGILKIAVPNAKRIETTIAEMKAAACEADMPTIMLLWPLEHINAFREPSLRCLAEAAGLVVVKPRYRDRFSFLARRGAVNPAHPAKAAKELVRPFYLYRNSLNLYMWMAKPAA